MKTPTSGVFVDNPAYPLIKALISYIGITSAAGNAGGTTFVCGDLVNEPPYVNMTVKLLDGPSAGQQRMITLNAAGTETVDVAFTNAAGAPQQVAAGIHFVIVSGGGGGGGGVAAMTPVSNVVAANWNSGVATSGLAGADLVTIGADNTNAKVHSALVNISALTPAAVITIRLYMQVNGTARQTYNQAFTQGVDPDGLWIVNGTVGIHEALRIEVASNAAGDDGRNIDYDYLIET